MKSLFIKVIRVLVSIFSSLVITGIALVLIQGLTSFSLMGCSDEVKYCDGYVALMVNIILIPLVAIMFYKVFSHIKVFLLVVILFVTLGLTFSIFARPYSGINKQVGKIDKYSFYLGMSTMVVLRDFQKDDYIIFKRDESEIDWLGYILKTPGEDNLKEDEYLVHGSGDHTEVVKKGQIKSLIWYP